MSRKSDAAAEAVKTLGEAARLLSITVEGLARITQTLTDSVSELKIVAVHQDEQIMELTKRVSSLERAVRDNEEKIADLQQR